MKKLLTLLIGLTTLTSVLAADFTSFQLASTTLTNGYILQTNGRNSRWVATSTLGFATGTNFWGGSLSGNIYSLNTGNVGIGTTAPLGKLHVASYPVYLGDTDDGTVKRAYVVGTQYNHSSEPEGYMVFGGASDSASDNKIYFGGGASGYNAATQLSFYTAANNTTRTGTERIRIDSTGNVGLGTTSPATILHLDGGAGALPVITLSAAGVSSQSIGRGSASFTGAAATDFGIRYSGSLYFGSTAAASLYISNTGGVAIGTTSVITNVSLAVGAGAVQQIPNGAGANFTPQVSNTQASGVAGLSVGVSDGTNNRRAGMFVNQTNGLWGLSSTYSSGAIPFVINDAGTERLRIDTSGNVGIGTSSPNANLQLGNTTSASTASTIKMSLGGTYASVAGSGSNAKLKLYEYGADVIGISVSSAQMEYITSVANYDHVWFGGSTASMTLDGSTRSLGVGTSTPTAVVTAASSTGTGLTKLLSAASSIGEMFSVFATGQVLFSTGTAANCGAAPCGVTVATTTQFTAGVVARVVGYASAASTTINLNTTDIATTTVDRATTFVNPTGTAYDGAMFEIRAKATTTQTVYFGTVFASSTDLTNVSSVASGTTRFLFEYRQDVGKWELVGKLGGYIN